MLSLIKFIMSVFLYVYYNSVFIEIAETNLYWRKNNGCEVMGLLKTEYVFRSKQF